MSVLPWRRLDIFGVPYFHCGRCDVWKPRAAFLKDRNAVDQVDNRCSRCRGRTGKGKRQRSLKQPRLRDRGPSLMTRMREIVHHAP